MAKDVTVYSRNGMFTSACGVDIPIFFKLGDYDNHVEAADAIAAYCGHDANTVENNDFIIVQNE